MVVYLARINGKNKIEKIFRSRVDAARWLNDNAPSTGRDTEIIGFVVE